MEKKELENRNLENKDLVEKLWKKAQERRTSIKNKVYDTSKEECYLCNTSTVPAIRFHAFDDMSFVNVAFSTRFGGKSTGYLSQLNLGFGRGEADEIVEENYRLFCESIDVTAKDLVLSDQVHDTIVKLVTKEDTCQEIIRKKLQGIDGLCTNQKNVCLATSYADCVPLFFVDPEKKIIAASHSGWKGTVGKIGTNTVKLMEKKFGSDTKDIIALVGPSICQECYEVSQDVITQFEEKYSHEQMQHIAYCSDNEKQKYQLDLWAANFLQLKEAGLLPEHIHVAGICTCCNDKLLFSHRASKGKRGNLNGFIALC